MFPDLNLGIGHFAFMSIRKTLLELFEPAMLINHLIYRFYCYFSGSNQVVGSRKTEYLLKTILFRIRSTL